MNGFESDRHEARSERRALFKRWWRLPLSANLEEILEANSVARGILPERFQTENDEES